MARVEWLPSIYESPSPRNASSELTTRACLERLAGAIERGCYRWKLFAIARKRVLDKLGGWTAGSPTREDTYQDREDELLMEATASVRRAWRAGEKSGPEGMPPSSDALLTLLPETLRYAALAHFGGAATSAVGTAVGTNENAAGIVDSDGAVSR